MQWFLIIIYLVVCFFLIGVVLMQRGKDSSGDLFGAGASSVLTGQGTTSFLVKLTATLSTLFFILSFFLGVVINQSAERIRIDDVLKAKDAIAVDSSQKTNAENAPASVSTSHKDSTDATAKGQLAQAKTSTQATRPASIKTTKHAKRGTKSVQSTKKVGKVSTS